MIIFHQGLNNKENLVVLESDIISVDTVTLHNLIAKVAWTYHDLAKEFINPNLRHINELVLI